MKPKLLLMEDFDNLQAKKRLSEHVDFVSRETVKWDENIIGAYTKLDTFYFHEDDYRWVPNFKFVATPCTGTDHIVLPKRYKLIYLDQDFKCGVGRQITSTAEHTLSLMLQLAKKKKMQLSGKTVGIIGCGRIGSEVSEYCFALGMNLKMIDAWDDYFVSRETLIKESDVISIHVPLNKDTKGMIGERELSMMKDGVMIINTSRQEVINVSDLLDAINVDKKEIYYADDFKNEYELSGWNFLQTPHIGGNCQEARMITDDYIVDKIIEEVKGGKIND